MVRIPIRILVVAVLCLFFVGSPSARAASGTEVVRGWKVSQITPLVFVLEKPEKKQSAIFSVSPADITLDESNGYIRSSAFARDAKRIRERDLAEALETEVQVAGDRRDFDGVSVGVIETRFTAEGRSILITEHVWLKNKLIFHFIVTSKNVVEQPSEIHKRIFDEFTKDFALKSHRSASIFDLILPRADAAESVGPNRSGAGGARGGGAARPAPRAGGRQTPANCVDRDQILGRDKSELRPGPPALHPSASMRSCGAGISRAWGEMKASMSGALNEIANEAGRYARQQRCEDMNPNSPARVRERNAARARARNSNWTRFTNFVTESLADSGAADAYNQCLTAAGTRAAVMYVARPVSQAAVSLARSGMENVRRDPARAAMNALIMTNPALMMTKSAMWAATGDNVEQAYNFLATQITGFTCLTNDLQTEAFCAFATKAAPELVLIAATGGYGAAVRGARVASALAKGLSAARTSLAAGSRRAIARAGAATAERRAAAGAAANVERRAAAAGGARGAASRESAPSSSATRTADSADVPAPAPAPTTSVAARIAASPTEVLASADEMAVLTSASSRSALASDGVSVLSSTAPGQRLTVSVTRQGRTVSQPVTREEALDLARDPSVTSLRVESVRPMGTTPRLTAAQTRKISPELTQTLAGYKPDSVVQVMVRYRSGEAAVFSGNPQMIRGLAARNDVVGVDTGIGAPSWIRPTYAIDEAARTGASPLTTMRAQLGEGSVITSGAELNYSNQVVFHGTVRENVASVRAGPQNVGAGFGGRGLYVALDNERDLAEGYSNLASQAAVNRVSNVAAVTDSSAIDRTAVVMRGRLNPNRNFRVGVFEIDRNAFAPDLRTGRLPANWDDDPRLRELMESEFDVIEVRNARRNGMNISSDRYLVVHERAGADAVTWQRTDVTNRPPRPAAATAQALPVNTQNVRMAEQVWRENGAPSRNFLPQLNVAERQQYAARVLSTGEMNARQATAFQRTAREFREELWSNEAGMAEYRRSASENLRRAGFTDEQIGTMFDSGAITGARPRR